MCGWRVQQLLRTAAAVQSVLTAVGRPSSLRGTSQTPALPAEGTPSGAGSLANSAAGDHRKILTETHGNVQHFESNVLVITDT